MDNFEKLTADERARYFNEASKQIDLNPQMVEKDFWVCWTLKLLFSLEEIGTHLTFKGGTSLSKVYNVIERFSEDIDISIERDFLGFGGDNEPEVAKSNKEKQRRIKSLQLACQNIIGSKILPLLEKSISLSLTNQIWSLELDPDDKDKQTLLFYYPRQSSEHIEHYVKPAVKIEFGARSDHWPVETKNISPYVSQIFASAFENSDVSVRVLKAERTFWEKATILHKLYHCPQDRDFPPRMSRHYYDLFQLGQSSFAAEAITNLELLARVAEHKSLFFRAAWAKYELAKPGSLKLLPGKNRINELKDDYEKMRSMFFNDPPSLDEILEGISKLEKKING